MRRSSRSRSRSRYSRHISQMQNATPMAMTACPRKKTVTIEEPPYALA